MKDAIAKINYFFDSMEWKYSYDEENSIYNTGVDMKSSLGTIALRIQVKSTKYVVYAIMSNKAESKFYPQIAEYLHRANYNLLNGNFEFDYNDGEIRYKTYVNFENSQLSNEIIRDSVLIPFFMFEKYGKNLLKLMIDFEDPHKLIIDTEKSQEEST